MIIREAQKKDITSLAKLLTKLFTIEEDFTPNQTRQEKGLSLLLENKESGFIFVAEEKQKVVAMGSVQFLISTSEGGRVGLIEDMIVAQECRYQGVGKRLLRSILKKAKEENCFRVQLLADIGNNPALKFYKKMKFSNTHLMVLRKKLT